MSGENHSGRFSMAEILEATNDFDESKILGEGGCGKVYRGVIIVESTETAVAVKRTREQDSELGTQGLKTEVKMLSKCKHSNLVNLLGFCSENQEMILVYEFMSRGSLADHLSKNKDPLLTWEQRLKICIGVARGLEYLHTGTGLSERIVHLDIKSDNILLNDDLAAKIGDLGLARIAPANQLNSQVSTAVLRGTPGYVDPEYSRTYKYSSKSDVYSFGVVLLEVLIGNPVYMSKIIPESGRAEWIQQQMAKKTLDPIVDPRIASQIQPRSLNCFLNTAKKMLQLDPAKRPAMSSVISELEYALKFQISSPTVDNDDPFEAGFEGQTSRSSYEPEFLGNAPNVFGEPIGDKQTAVMGFDPTRANRALAAFRTRDHDKFTKAKVFVQQLNANSGIAMKTLCMIYNATGETLAYVTSSNLSGETMPYSYPTQIHNGQWGTFMHRQTSMMSMGSVGAVVYRGKYTDNASCDRMISWSNIFNNLPAGYCEINEVGHFDAADWNSIFKSRLNFAGPENTVTWNDCLAWVQIQRDMNSTVLLAIISQAGIQERSNQNNNGQPLSHPSTEI